MKRILADTYGKTISVSQSGVLVEIQVLDDARWRSSYKDTTDIHERFKLSIQGVNPSSYNTSFFVIEDNIYLAMNFTTDFNNKEMTIKTDGMNSVLVRSVIPENSLILIEDERKLIVSGRESIDEDTLRAMGTGGKIAGTVLSSAALVIAGLGFFSVCVPFGVGSFILSFFQIIEIISRFKYINVNYG